MIKTTTEAIIPIAIQTGIITAIISAPIVQRKGEELDKSLGTKISNTTAKEAEHQWQDHLTKNKANAPTTMLLNPKTLTTEAIKTTMPESNSKNQGAIIINTVVKDTPITSDLLLVQEVELSIKTVIDKDLTKLM